MYQALLVSFDGDYVTTFEATTVEEVLELLANRGSRWLFYPLEFVVKSPLNQNGRIISAPYRLSFLRGKRVGKVLQVIHDVALDNPQDFACEVASRICDPKASVRRDVLYEAFDLDELSLDHELFSFGPALQAMGRYGEVRVEVLFPPSLPPIVKLLKNGVVVMVLVQEGKLRRKVLNDVIRAVNSSSRGRLLKLRVGTATWKQLLRND